MSGSKKDVERKRKEAVEKLKSGEYLTIAERPLSAYGSFWEHLSRIKCLKNEYQLFVQCRLCHEILSYSVPNGTSTISYHVKNCLDEVKILKNHKTLDTYLAKSIDANVILNDKRSITIACAKFCSFDMSSFNIVKDSGFISLYQNLIDLGYQYGTGKVGIPSASSLLPDTTNISRTVHQLAEEYKENLNDILKNDLQNLKLIAVSTDYWKNAGTSQSYLTVNIHYTKNERNVTYMLRTSLFDESKTGDNTRKELIVILSSYGIDPHNHHIVYITDNGSNLVCGLRECLVYI